MISICFCLPCKNCGNLKRMNELLAKRDGRKDVGSKKAAHQHKLVQVV